MISLFCIKSYNSPFEASYMITKISFVVSRTSYNLMMLGWLINFKILISLFTFLFKNKIPLRSCSCFSFSSCLLSLLLLLFLLSHDVPLDFLCMSTFNLCEASSTDCLAQDIMANVDLLHYCFWIGNLFLERSITFCYF